MRRIFRIFANDMELQENSIIVSDRLDGVFDVELRNHFTHAYCTAGQCEMTYNGEGIRVAKGDCMIIIANQLVTAIRPSENFRVKVIYIEVGFLEACTPHTSYGVTGGLTMFVNPVMHLNEREQWLCERDFDEVAQRLREPHRYFQGDAMMAVTQTMFCDFYEFHARIYGQPQVSALTASVMKRFIDMLERGDYRRSREVGYYADKLCVTPKYLSEVCRKVSGYSANFWINRYATIDIARLLRDKSLSLTDIADMYGFTSQSHFTRYVQQNLGATPSVFRS